MWITRKTQKTTGLDYLQKPVGFFDSPHPNTSKSFQNLPYFLPLLCCIPALEGGEDFFFGVEGEEVVVTGIYHS